MERQSIVNITGSGYVNKINLTKDEEKGYIRGRIGIRVDKDNVVNFDVFESKVNKGSGKDNFKYKAFETIMNEYVDASMVEDYKEATKVFIGENKEFPQFPNATIDVSIYESQGAVQTTVKNKLSLMNRIKDDKPVYAGLKFSIDGFIVKELVPEYDEAGIETGRGILTGYIVDYTGKARELTLIVIAEGFSQVKDVWKSLYTLNLKGELINKKVEVEDNFADQQTGGFSTTSRTKSEYIREYIITDAGVVYDSFTKEECESAIAKLEEHKNFLLAGEKASESEVDDDVIPF